MLKFEVRPLVPGDDREFGVYAVVPAAGNDAALLAVFESRLAAETLLSYYLRLLPFASSI